MNNLVTSATKYEKKAGKFKGLAVKGFIVTLAIAGSTLVLMPAKAEASMARDVFYKNSSYESVKAHYDKMNGYVEEDKKKLQNAKTKLAKSFAQTALQVETVVRDIDSQMLKIKDEKSSAEVKEKAEKAIIKLEAKSIMTPFILVAKAAYKIGIKGVEIIDYSLSKVIKR